MNKNNDFFPGEQGLFREALEKLKGRKVAVMGHMRPDGDCIGSIVALTRVLNASPYGIEAIGVNRDATPGNLKTFLGDTPFFNMEEAGLDGRTAITVDSADENRISEELRSRFDKIHLNVDHHISNPGYADYNLVVGDSSATAEILAGLFLDLDLPMDAVTAQALYVGIATDTGQFRFSSTTPQVFEICWQLCERGADPAKAAYSLYENESFSKLLLLQRFLASLTREFDGRVCIGQLREEDFEVSGANADETEGMVDYARSIEGTEIGVLIEERHGGIKASLRAKNPVLQVQEVARQFGGGGHACAAGLNVDMPLSEFRTRLLEKLGEHLNRTGRH